MFDASSLPDLPLPGGGALDGGVVLGIGLGSAALGALAWLAILGLRHVDRRNVLHHPMRSALLKDIEENPGLHLRQLATRHNTAVTNLQWHLRKLEEAGLVRTQKAAGFRLYHAAGGGIASRDQALRNAATRHPTAEAILRFLEANAGATAEAAAVGLKMNPATARWHLRRLSESHLVRGVATGAEMHYFPLAAAVPAQAAAAPLLQARA